jgi:formimidoylglutamate deiminase
MTEPQALFFETALLPGGWTRDVRIRIGADGTIAALSTGARPEADDVRHAVGVPGMVNLHSHAFQRAMAGLTERRDNPTDSFWTWRAWMYRFVERLTPDDLAAVAALAYAEMLETGFTGVCEFHYLHNRPDGGHYDDPAAMSAAICEAAAETGVGLTLLPVFYERGGFDGRPLTDAQARFANSLDSFAALHDAAADHVGALTGGRMGIAPHSLRAVSPKSLETLAVAHAGGPIHIHIAEQTAEVEDCRTATGARPVAWLLANAPVGATWCLIHATHIDDGERAGIEAANAVAGLCPVTEANLGDGLFPADRYRGAFGVGSDSNVRISLSEELSLLEYGQRLTRRERAILAPDGGGSVGGRVFKSACAGGSRAAGRETGALTEGARADIVALDTAHPALIARSGDSLLDGWIFAGDSTCVDAVWVGGRQVVAHGRHVRRDAVRARYAQVLNRLTEGL